MPPNNRSMRFAGGYRIRPYKNQILQERAVLVRTKKERPDRALFVF